ncbi:hypothetical protein MMC16_003457 [Acarospora aff. strigata]|nr:hypothetical protein [Acarospora aff. strigata]
MQPNEPLQQTFGVELEFVVGILPEGHLDRRTAVEEPLEKLLVAGGFAVNDPESGSYEKWTIAGDSSIKAWENEDDDPNPQMGYLGVELKSRILPVNHSSFQEVRQIVDIVTKNFKIMENRSTGLHIHVGNGNRGYSVRCLQNLAEIVTIFEHQIHSLHPEDRLSSFWCAPPSKIFDCREDPFHAVAQIERIGSLMRFIDHMNQDSFRFVAYNFLNLRNVRNTQTIEFRQHRGTMDADEIIAWAEFTTGIVEYCHGVPPDRFMRLLLTFGADSEFSLLDLLQVIGKAHLISYYKRRLFDRERPVNLFKMSRDEEDVGSVGSIITELD